MILVISLCVLIAAIGSVISWGMYRDEMKSPALCCALASAWFLFAAIYMGVNP